MTNKLFYFSIEKVLIQKISDSKKKLQIAVAWFTNPVIYQLILKLIDEGVIVELIIADDVINFTNSLVNFQKIIDRNVDFRISKSPNLMHNKFCIIDDNILINGSYNWTLKAENSNFENIVVSTDRNLLNEFNNYFNYLKRNTAKITLINTQQFNKYISEEEVKIEFEFLNNFDDKSIENFKNETINERINDLAYEAVLDAQYNYQIDRKSVV